MEGSKEGRKEGGGEGRENEGSGKERRKSLSLALFSCLVVRI